MGKALNFKNEVGNRYGTLTVVEYIGSVGIGHAKWLCSCDCGGTHEATGTTLRSGKCVTCKDCRKEHQAKRKTIHGCSYSDTFKGTPAYRSWIAMKARCYNPDSSSFKNYGARGIKVCDRWLEPDGKGFLNFLEDVGERPDGMTLDRIDSNEMYKPGNCKWSTYKEQAANKRNTRKYDVQGEILTLAEISERLCISYHTAYDAIVTRKVDVDEYMNKKTRELNKFRLDAEAVVVSVTQDKNGDGVLLCQAINGKQTGVQFECLMRKDADENVNYRKYSNALLLIGKAITYEYEELAEDTEKGRGKPTKPVGVALRDMLNNEGRY